MPILFAIELNALLQMFAHGFLQLTRAGTCSRSMPRKIQGLAIAARPIMTASQFVCCFMRWISAMVFTSPLPITGILTSDFTSAIASQSACHCSAVLLCVREWQSANHHSLPQCARSTYSFYLYPIPNGSFLSPELSRAEVNFLNVRAIFNGVGIMPTPAPRSAMLLAGQPMLISIISGFQLLYLQSSF